MTEKLYEIRYMKREGRDLIWVEVPGQWPRDEAVRKMRAICWMHGDPMAYEVGSHVGMRWESL